MQKDRVTLRDVARYAGVSVGSVSRYLNDNSALGPKTRDLIEKAISKLNYKPNLLAQNLARGSSRNLLLYIYQEFPIFNTTWLFELPIIHGIYDYLKGTDFRLQIAIGNVLEPDRFKREVIAQTESGLVDGILILSSWPAEKSLLIRLMDSKFPFVLISNANQIDPVNSIVFDNELAMFDIAGMLLDLGHRDFAFLGGYDTQLHTRERFDGFARALAERGKKPNPAWIKYGDYSFESGVRFMDEIIAAGPPVPTAVLAGNDFVAAGAMRSLQRRGLSVPGDVSVAGFDNLTVSNIVDPELTTVKVPLFEMGRRATEKLVECIDSKRCVFPSETIKCETVVRSSTAEAIRN